MSMKHKYESLPISIVIKFSIRSLGNAGEIEKCNFVETDLIMK